MAGYNHNEKVVCIGRKWAYDNGLGKLTECDGPKYGEVYTVVGVKKYDGELFVELKEYPREWWISTKFRPLHDDIVRNIIAQVTERPVVLN